MKPNDLLRNLFIMAFADGEISSEELSLLAERRRWWGISQLQFEATLQEAEALHNEQSKPMIEQPIKVAEEKCDLLVKCGRWQLLHYQRKKIMDHIRTRRTVSRRFHTDDSSRWRVVWDQHFRG